MAHRCRPAAPEPLGDLVAVHAGQADVEQDELGPDARGRPRWPRGRRGRLATSWPEQPAGAWPGPAAVSTLSSTTRTRGRPARPRARGRRRGPAPGRRGLAEAGSRTVNSLPLPGPVARGRDAPAVHLDELLDERQADPQAALGAGERAVALGEELEDLRAASRAGCPMPLSRDADDDRRRPLAPAVERDPPAGARCTSRRWSAGSRATCSSRVGSASSQTAPRRCETSARASAPRRAAGPPRRRWRRPAASVEPLLPELDLAAGDPGDVQQVVDQPGEVLDLPLDDVLGPVDGAPAVARPRRAGRRRC